MDAVFEKLTAYAHDKQWEYIYPVWSRRAQGLSIGINLHPNHCCNWHCLYCQVPGLQRGPSPLIDEVKLYQELQDCFSWLIKRCSHQQKNLNELVQDIAFAGAGEPTTSPQFVVILDQVIHWLTSLPITSRPATVRLITNGSQLHHANIQNVLKRLNDFGGEVWFKLDAGTDDEMTEVNATHLPLALHIQRLNTCTKVCKTWVQTALLTRQVGQTIHTSPTLSSYLNLLLPYKQAIQGILLYGIARPSQQDSQGIIRPTSVELLETYAQTLRMQGFCVRLFE